MVGVINPVRTLDSTSALLTTQNATMTWEAQYKKAKQYPYMLVPGQSPPAEGSQSGSSSSGSNSGSGSSPGSDSGSKSGSSGLSKDAIAGIAVAVVAFVGILCALLFILGRNLVYRKWMSSHADSSERTSRWVLSDKGEYCLCKRRIFSH